MNTPCDVANAVCPVCRGTATVVQSFERHALVTGLAAIWGKVVPPDVMTVDYKVLRCSACTLEFASPMIAASNELYCWLAHTSAYYPESRWEWRYLLGRLSNSAGTLLEVGCGAGAFLNLLRECTPINGTGVDMLPSAVEACHSRGIQAYCSDLQGFLSSAPNLKFDYVVAFHCLEHVERPVDLLRAMLGAVRPGGTVLVSTPYSPCYSERLYFDPLSYPPHHLTRWNVKAYEKLASILGISDLRFHVPPIPPPFKRALETLYLKYHPLLCGSSRVERIRTAGQHPLLFLAELRHQLSLPRYDGRQLGSVVLVEFRA